MIALHVTWLRGSGLALWGEDSELPAHARARRGRPAARPRPRAHPFAAPARHIASALAVDGSGVDAATLTLTLPSCPTGPQASLQLLRSEPVSHRERPDRLDRWTVPAVLVDGPKALEVLLDLPDAPGAGVAFGPSLRSRRRSPSSRLSSSPADSSSPRSSAAVRTGSRAGCR